MLNLSSGSGPRALWRLHALLNSGYQLIAQR